MVGLNRRKALPIPSIDPFLLASERTKAMEKCSWNLSFVSVYLLLLLLSFFISTVKASSALQLMENSAQDSVCALVDCGQGRCIASSADFDCECNPGWQKIQIGSLTFPSCVVPNCTLNLQCGNGMPPSQSSSPPSPPPSPPGSLFPPLPKLLDPCTYTWCGDGKCVANGSTGHTCQCNEGSANVLNNTRFACLKQCNFGGDCMGLGFGQPPPPPPNFSGSIQVQNCWSRRLQALTIGALAAVFLI